MRWRTAFFCDGIPDMPYEIGQKDSPRVSLTVPRGFEEANIERAVKPPLCDPSAEHLHRVVVSLRGGRNDECPHGSAVTPAVVLAVERARSAGGVAVRCSDRLEGLFKGDLHRSGSARDITQHLKKRSATKSLEWQRIHELEPAFPRPPWTAVQPVPERIKVPAKVASAFWLGGVKVGGPEVSLRLNCAAINDDGSHAF
ncbi:MAG TPA: hypothetical protein VIN58_06985 [Roseateles sp.]